MSRYDYILELSRFDVIEVAKENPYHDPKTGQFTSAPGGRAPSAGPSKSQGTMAELQGRIARGEVSTALDIKKQSKHIKGSKEYLKARKEGKFPSWLSIGAGEQQAIIDKYTKTGKAYRQNDGTIRVRFNHSDTIGAYVSRDGNITKITSKGQIHYSKSGAHIVPDDPR